MGDLTANLSRSEFACKCILPECKHTPIDFELVTAIQGCHDWLEQEPTGFWFERIAVHINSGYRCPAHDRAVQLKYKPDFNGKLTSKHILGLASDHWFEYVMQDGTRRHIDDEIIAKYYESKFVGRCGIGRYDGRTHLDFRSGPSARWNNRTEN